mmetsp:Transcript_19545/g.42191  ORF Transcript_19545/g.42191 Transcript_19545/m.42191 type:complete len:127 (+) Transcript_19545:1542-1922(+)
MHLCRNREGVSGARLSSRRRERRKGPNALPTPLSSPQISGYEQILRLCPCFLSETARARCLAPSASSPCFPLLSSFLFLFFKLPLLRLHVFPLSLSPSLFLLFNLPFSRSAAGPFTRFLIQHPARS